MALKKALVLGADGSIQQLQAGDDLEVGVGNQGFSAINNNLGAITQGLVVYISSIGAVDLANALTTSTSKVVGLVKDAAIASTASGVIITDGILDIADWTSITGTATLTAGQAYFLSDIVAGKLVTTRPVLTGSSVVYIGRAVNTTSLELSIERPILL